MKVSALFSIFSFLLFLNFSAQKSNNNQNVWIKSPNNAIHVNISLRDGRMFYGISYKNKEILESSSLGIFREDADFSKDIQWISASENKTVEDHYQLITSKKSKIDYQANQRRIVLKNSKNEKFSIEFQVSDDGVAFRYAFLENSKEVKRILSEESSFHFKKDTKAWLQPKEDAHTGWRNVQPAYENHYKNEIPVGTPSPSKNGWVYPALFKTGDTWIVLTEAALGRSYCGTSLQQFSPNNEYKINFPQAQEKIGDGALLPESTLPWTTPWRVLAIGSLKTIVESTLGTDLAFPSKNRDFSFVKPGRSSWSWILKKESSINYNEQKSYIDYASDMHWEYCLIDAEWDKNIGYDKVKELSQYALNKGVGLFLWYCSSGDWNAVELTPKDKLLTHESREKEFSLLEKMGIKGIKVDFFGGDGLSMMTYYQDILEDAAKHKLLVNFHGATLPRGLQRTYPNLITAEAVYGYEMITYNQQDADVAPSHMINCAFIRNAFDPMDFTPVSLYQIPNIKRRTTAAFELATSVIFQSGVQHFVESPEGMAQMPASIKEYMRNVPSYWEDTKFLDGYPSEFIAIARKSGKKWYIGAINADEKPKEFSFDRALFKNYKTATVYKMQSNGILDVKKISISQLGKKFVIEPNDGLTIVLEE